MRTVRRLALRPTVKGEIDSVKRRGMSILELLIALALLGALCSLLTSWLVTVSRLSADRGPRLEWRSAALRILDSIEDDLACGDFEPGARNSASRPRVEVLEPSRLRIRTRSTSTQAPNSPGPAIHEYRFDQVARTLFLSVSSSSGPTSSEDRALAGAVADWMVNLDDEQRVVTITIQSDRGDELRRRFTWP